ncbi:MAG: biopolymer transporter ExbD [Methylomicrobium sp.]
MNKRSLFKNRTSSGEDGTETINMTPLIDMVFILLIFFLVTSSFIRESAVIVERPKATTAVPQQDNALIVTLSADEQIWLDDAAVDIRLLRERCEQREFASPSRPVIILADTQTSTGLLVSVMDQLRLAGFVNISVAASVGSDLR